MKDLLPPPPSRAAGALSAAGARVGSEARRLRSRYVLRALDACLTAALEPRADAPVRPQGRGRGNRRFERLRGIAQWAFERAPALRPAVCRRLLARDRLPFRGARIELAGLGTWATVFRLDTAAGGAPWALKVHRPTLGLEPRALAAAARRGDERYRRLREAFGGAVLPGRFVVLHAPLRGAAAVACLQPLLTGRLHDLLGLDARELRALLERHPRLHRSFALFATRALAAWDEGWFPDLLGRGNLIAAGADGELRLWLIDYGIIDRHEVSRRPRARAAAEVARRLEALLEPSALDEPALEAGARSSAAP